MGRSPLRRLRVVRSRGSICDRSLAWRGLGALRRPNAWRSIASGFAGTRSAAGSTYDGGIRYWSGLTACRAWFSIAHNADAHSLAPDVSGKAWQRCTRRGLDCDRRHDRRRCRQADRGRIGRSLATMADGTDDVLLGRAGDREGCQFGHIAFAFSMYYGRRHREHHESARRRQ